MADIRDLNEMLEEVEGRTPVYDDCAQGADQAYRIFVLNAVSNSKTDMYVYGENTLGQVFDDVKTKIGVFDNKLLFFNQTNGKSTADKNMSLADFQICADDTLAIQSDGGVAAVN